MDVKKRVPQHACSCCACIQGFTKAVTLEKDRWQGYIKDYDGGTLMECVMNPKARESWEAVVREGRERGAALCCHRHDCMWWLGR